MTAGPSVAVVACDTVLPPAVAVTVTREIDILHACGLASNWLPAWV